MAVLTVSLSACDSGDVNVRSPCASQSERIFSTWIWAKHLKIHIFCIPWPLSKSQAFRLVCNKSHRVLQQRRAACVELQEMIWCLLGILRKILTVSDFRLRLRYCHCASRSEPAEACCSGIRGLTSSCLFFSMTFSKNGVQQCSKPWSLVVTQWSGEAKQVLLLFQSWCDCLGTSVHICTSQVSENQVFTPEVNIRILQCL